jgi:site-specific DNA-methyltransferase (adenine-specific)
LGRHRLICGNSNEQAIIDKLLQGIKLDAIIQDPPYGVLDVEWDRPLNQKDLDIAIYNTDGPIMMFNATKPNLFEKVLQLEPKVDRIMVWRMTAGITGKGGLFWTWQPVFVWQANKTMIGWDSIEFESAAPDRTGEHLTQKPIGLIAKYIKAIPKAKNIGDFFMGSGTTLLAAEQTGTNAFGVELNPQFCDVIIQRWETLTGEKAVLVNNAESTEA